MTLLRIVLLVLAIVLVIVGVSDLIGGAVIWGVGLIVIGLAIGAFSDRPRL